MPEMPKQRIELPSRVEHLSILDEDGNPDEELDPGVDDETLIEMHRRMLLSRRFDERLLKLQRQGSIGTFAPVQGQEASQIGAVAALEMDDWVVPAFRETAAAVWRGQSLEGLLLFNAGYNEGADVPEDRRDLPIAIPVASQIPHAVGIAYGAKLSGDNRVVMVFFGDGATSQGDFHEALNFAGVFETPVVFLCQNNRWAISVPRERQSRSKTLAQKALAYGIPGIQVDGNDVLAVHAAAVEAVQRARSGGGPTMIECLTYRLSVHTTADDPDKYRDQEEVERWKERDPIPRFQAYLRNHRQLLDDGVAAIEKAIEEEIDAAWKKAKKRMEELDDPLVIFEHVYDEMPRNLAEQRDALARSLEDRRESGDG
jgi:pyruvate dehydrogenase E1 component alpha subunit